MKDFISKLTFGFLMAQLFPGAVVVFAIRCVAADKYCQPGDTLWHTMSQIGSSLSSDNIFTTVVLGLLAIGVGMCIHGLNWAVLAWLEHVAEMRGWRSIRGDLWWHRWPIWSQLLLSPVFMVVEVLWLLGGAKLMDLIMEENVPGVGSDKMDHFNFLQDFYLHFGQFFAHMAYALLVTTICVCTCLIGKWDKGRVELAILFYLSTSMLFLLGRIQLGSLFGAEASLVRGSVSDTSESKQLGRGRVDQRPLKDGGSLHADQPTRSPSASPRGN
jgi:hypothetical protein